MQAEHCDIRTVLVLKTRPGQTYPTAPGWCNLMDLFLIYHCPEEAWPSCPCERNFVNGLDPEEFRTASGFACRFERLGCAIISENHSCQCPLLSQYQSMDSSADGGAQSCTSAMQLLTRYSGAVQMCSSGPLHCSLPRERFVPAGITSDSNTSAP